MKATRTRCLRCFEPLDPTAPPPMWRTLMVSDRVGIVAGTVAIAAAIGFVWVLWSTSPLPWEREAQSAADAPIQPGHPGPATTAVEPSTAASAAPSGQARGPADAPVDSTREVYEDKLKTNPNDVVAVNGLGLVLERQGVLAEAVVHFRRATEIAPDRISYRMNLAEAEGRLGQWDKAVVDYREAAKLAPDDYGAHYNLGLALHQRSDDQAAVAEFESAVRLAPGDPDAYRPLGASLEAVGRIDAAIDAYQRYLELAPGTEETQRVRRHAEQLSMTSQRSDASRRGRSDQSR